MSRRFMTDCGLPGISQVPYGVHMCHFYSTRDELAAVLVPYFVAGLRSNERCIWVCAEPLAAVDARAELARAGVDVDAAIARGALVLRDFSDWYAESEQLKGTDVVNLWLGAEERALAEGYSGLRITGNVTFLQGAADWETFMEYEKAVDEAFRARRIVTLCTYRREGAAEMLDVIQRHSCTLERPDEGWQILT
ncbi:MAG TPA: MEDS domain-containing protein [Burkholderiales bacterium]|nr:MEDS domain-containing protein [Burkholderiales bacterium]